MRLGPGGPLLRRRWVPALVSVVQLTAFTWVPFVHPLLHRVPDPGPSGAALSSVPEAGPGHSDELFCWACLAEAGFAASSEIAVGRVTGEETWTDLPPTTRAAPTRDIPRANPVRAPPTH